MRIILAASTRRPVNPLEDYLAVEREPVEHVHVARVRDEEAPPVPPAGYRQPRAVDDVAVGVRRLVPVHADPDALSHEGTGPVKHVNSERHCEKASVSTSESRFSRKILPNKNAGANPLGTNR